MGMYQQVLTYGSWGYEYEMIKKAETTMLENLLIKAIEEEGIKDGKAYSIETQTSIRVDQNDGLNRLRKGLRIEEIVRCKDCKNYSQDYKTCNIMDCFGWEYMPNDYCSYGERKDNIT